MMTNNVMLIVFVNPFNQLERFNSSDSKYLKGAN